MQPKPTQHATHAQRSATTRTEACSVKRFGVLRCYAARCDAPHGCSFSWKLFRETIARSATSALVSETLCTRQCCRSALAASAGGPPAEAALDTLRAQQPRACALMHACDVCNALAMLALSLIISLARPLHGRHDLLRQANIKSSYEPLALTYEATL